MAVQVAQLRQQLDDGTLLILYDTGNIRTTIVPTERVPDELKDDIDVWPKLTDHIGSEHASSRFLDRWAGPGSA